MGTVFAQSVSPTPVRPAVQATASKGCVLKFVQAEQAELARHIQQVSLSQQP